MHKITCFRFYYSVYAKFWSISLKLSPFLGRRKSVFIMNNTRPVYISFVGLPITAVTSITHRLTGVVMFASIPILLALLSCSLESEDSFVALQETLSGILPRLILWAIVASYIFHVVAGARHLLMDLGIGETLEGGRRGSILTLVFSAILILLAGVWLCPSM